MNKEFLNKRYKKEKRFILIGRVAVSLTIIFLVILLGSILLRGISGFYTTNIFLTTNLSQEIIDPENKKNVEEIYKSSWRKIARNSIYDVLSAFNKSKNIDKISRKDKRDFLKLFSRSSEFYIRDFTLENLDSIGKEVKISIPSSSLVDQFLKGKINIAVNEDDRPINDKQISWINFMVENKMIERKFNINFFYKGDSRNAEEAGILGAIVGSFFVILVAIIVAFPVGVMSAIYLEEFAPKNKITNIIEVNINNLAAVPSIVFGLLGLAIFLNFFGLPRSSPLAGGLVLALMTLPTIIISSRVAIKSVPPSIREAAMGIGASKMQSVFHHVIPLAVPGILTGTIIGMARALGETAPLLMMGMVAFIVDVPQSITDPSTVLPAQIFLWSDQPERGFEEKTAAATIILLVFLLTMNALAVFLRYKYERKW
ncbi:MAG: phosphate ABC transporter, permease protein PstA [Pelagibacterales bacterium]|nr:phosphate ABC transporter, permease protein PstA [Pelagibacterales bacterium]|tara:strand:- start:1039 stop:2322 length:1284 start_codon:yes stop_codon:yes gene_type:complete